MYLVGLKAEPFNENMIVTGLVNYLPLKPV